MKKGAPLLRVEEMKANLRALKGVRVESLRLMLADRNGITGDVVHGILEVAGGRFHRFFLDTGVLLWEEVTTLEPGDTDPAEADSPGARGLVDVPVQGAVLERVAVAPEDEGARLEMVFTDGRRLVLQAHDEGGDAEHVTWTL